MNTKVNFESILLKDPSITSKSVELQQDVMEIEKLNRTNESLLESLSEEKNFRAKLEDKLNTIWVGNTFFLNKNHSSQKFFFFFFRMTW
jgi:hypothetical protein